ncbi:MAG: hypothetical protein HY337_01315 [Gemmatimonadetes bacterium]|nr:hypothetical protein [Gemmatimonadota bacterium]
MVAASLAVGAAILLLALVGLALQSNWLKLARVALAAAGYAAVLVGLLRARQLWDGPAHRLPYWPFAVAGVSGGLVSGVMRPESSVPLVVADVVGAGVLLAGLHWVTVRSWHRVRDAVEGR